MCNDAGSRAGVLLRPLWPGSFYLFDSKSIMNNYHTVGTRVSGVVMLKEPLVGSLHVSKKMFLGRGIVKIEQANGCNWYRIVMMEKDICAIKAVIPIHYIGSGEGRNIVSKTGLKKTRFVFNMIELLDTNTDCLERLTLKMSRNDADDFANSFLFVWNAEERHRHKQNDAHWAATKSKNNKNPKLST